MIAPPIRNFKTPAEYRSKVQQGNLNISRQIELDKNYKIDLSKQIMGVVPEIYREPDQLDIETQAMALLRTVASPRIAKESLELLREFDLLSGFDTFGNAFITQQGMPQYRDAYKFLYQFIIFYTKQMSQNLSDDTIILSIQKKLISTILDLFKSMDIYTDDEKDPQSVEYNRIMKKSKTKKGFTKQERYDMLLLLKELRARKMTYHPADLLQELAQKKKEFEQEEMKRVAAEDARLADYLEKLEEERKYIEGETIKMREAEKKEMSLIKINENLKNIKKLQDAKKRDGEIAAYLQKLEEARKQSEEDLSWGETADLYFRTDVRSFVADLYHMLEKSKYIFLLKAKMPYDKYADIYHELLTGEKPRSHLPVPYNPDKFTLETYGDLVENAKLPPPKQKREEEIVQKNEMEQFQVIPSPPLSPADGELKSLDLESKEPGTPQKEQIAKKEKIRELTDKSRRYADFIYQEVLKQFIRYRENRFKNLKKEYGSLGNIFQMFLDEFKLLTGVPLGEVEINPRIMTLFNRGYTGDIPDNPGLNIGKILANPELTEKNANDLLADAEKEYLNNIEGSGFRRTPRTPRKTRGGRLPSLKIIRASQAAGNDSLRL